MRNRRRQRASRVTQIGWLCFVAAISWGELERPAHAHPLAPSLLELKELEPERFAVRFKKSLLRPAGVDVRPVLPDSCQGIGEPALSRDASSAILDWEVECPGGLVGETLRVEGLAESRTDALVRVAMSDGRVVQAVLDGSGAGLEVPARQGRFQVFVDYLDLGFEHILTGVDHLLFVLGLVLLVHGWRSLLTTLPRSSGLRGVSIASGRGRYRLQHLLARHRVGA